MQRSYLITVMMSSVCQFACASTMPGTRPHDMSAPQHERESEQHAQQANAEMKQYDGIAAVQTSCFTDGKRGARSEVCWTSTLNPTAAHLQWAEAHRRQAAAHRSASTALRQAEASACAGIQEVDRDISPFAHVEDIIDVQPLVENAGGSKVQVERATGAIITFRAVPGMTAEWLQRVVDCHLARNSARGHVAPEMPSCPLVLRNVEARVRSVGNGFAVEVRSDEPATSEEIWSRAQRLSRRSGENGKTIK